MSPTSLFLRLTCLCSLAASGCLVVPSHPRDGGASTSGSTSTTTPSYASYTVLAGAGALIPAGGRGFTLTANSGGSYRLAWSDTYGDSTFFEGTAWTDGQFADVVPVGNSYVVRKGDDTVDVQSIPYDRVDGVDLLPTLQPLYVDVSMNGLSAPIYFVDGVTGFDSQAYGPAVFYIN